MKELGRVGESALEVKINCQFYFLAKLSNLNHMLPFSPHGTYSGEALVLSRVTWTENGPDEISERVRADSVSILGALGTNGRGT